MIEFGMYLLFHNLPIALTATAITLLFLGTDVSRAAIPFVIGMALLGIGRLIAHWLARPSRL